MGNEGEGASEGEVRMTMNQGEGKKKRGEGRMVIAMDGHRCSVCSWTISHNLALKGTKKS